MKTGKQGVNNYMKRKNAWISLSLALAIAVAVTMSGCLQTAGGQHWTSRDDVATFDMTWGLTHPAAIFVEGQGTFNPPVQIYVQGTIVVSNAASCSSTASVDVYVTPVGVDDPVSLELDRTISVNMVKTGTNQWTGSVDEEFTGLGYSELGIPNVGNARDLECRVTISVTVDGQAKNLVSRSSSAGLTLHVERTSEAGVQFNWQGIDVYT